MESTTATRPADQPTRVKRGFRGICCILCADAEAVISLDLDDCHTLRCGACDDTFTLEDVREHVAAWQRVIAWVDAAPLAE
jgi:hypothetical protein